MRMLPAFEARLGALVIATSFLLIACSANHQVTTPAVGAPAVAQRASAQLRISIPRAGVSRLRRPSTVSPSLQSLVVSSTTGGPVVASTVNLTAQSPNCTSSASGLTCTATVSVAVGNDTITFTGYDGVNGTGQVISSAKTIAAMSATGANTINVSLNSVISGAALGLSPSLLTIGTAANVMLVVSGIDVDGNIIIGPGNYVDANGNPVTIALTLTDAFSVTSLSATSVSGPGNASVTLSYNGGIVGVGSSVQVLGSGSPSTNAFSSAVALGFGTTGPALYAFDNSSTYIAAFVPSQNGNVAPTRQILATLIFPQDVTTDAAGSIYVTDANGGIFDRVQIYAPGATGNAAPLRTITGPATGLNLPLGVTIDPSGNIWVSNQGTPSITVYAPGANGNVTPLGSIQGGATQLVTPCRMIFDPSGNLIIADQIGGRVLTFSAAQVASVIAGATLNAAPVANLSGGNTALNNPTAVALDSAGLLYVANRSNIGSLTVYAPPFGGNVFPIRNIVGPGNDTTTMLGSPIGLIVDSNQNVVVATQGYLSVPALVLTFSQTNIGSSPPGNGLSVPTPQNLAPNSILQDPYIPAFGCFDGLRATTTRLFVVDDCSSALWGFAPGASGFAPALQAILSPQHFATTMTSDAAGNLWTVNQDGMIAAFAPGAAGYAQPLHEFGGANSQLTNPWGIGVDASGYVYVSNTAPQSILVFAPGAIGNVAPVRVISGPATGIVDFTGTHKILFDAAGNLYVADRGNRIDIFAPGANGNVTPFRTISGPNTGLNNPIDIAFDGSGNLYVMNNSVPSIAQFSLAEINSIPTGGNGNFYPIRTIQGGATLLTVTNKIASDAAGDVYATISGGQLAGYSAAAVSAIPPGTGAAPGGVGNLAPSTLISGPSTTLISAGGVLIAP